MAEQAYRQKTYIGFALDPIHIGTGNDQLGRVDNPIIRDPVSNLPKLPASSISGVTKAYATLHFSDRYFREHGKRDSKLCAENIKERYCAEPECPVCVTFGFAAGEKRRAPEGLIGMSQFFDGQILFFPVHSMFGTVWVTSPNTLSELAKANFIAEADVNTKLAPSSNKLQTAVQSKQLNLGWLLLDVEYRESPLLAGAVQVMKQTGVNETILNSLVLVSDKLFSQVVNSNLEIRTSTSIDPLTGASKEGALFTFETIPRTTVFSFSIVYKDPRNFKLGENYLTQDIDWVMKNVETGLSYCQYFGIGGMTTRGMGRLQVLNLSEKS